MFNAERVTNDIAAWIRGYFEENGKDCVAVVGISGGKDSSVTAALCAKALGADRVLGVLMPQGVQPDIGVAAALVRHLGVPHRVINICGAVDALYLAIADSGARMTEQVRINTPARVRMTALYAVAAGENGRVANTCNLSEDWVGYSTKFGDAAGDFSPLSELTVTEIKAIGRALRLPEEFIEKVPIDGLSGKTDEENLGFTYDVLDKYIRDGVCGDEAVRKRIDELHRLSRHKIEPMPRYKYR